MCFVPVDGFYMSMKWCWTVFSLGIVSVFCNIRDYRWTIYFHVYFCFISHEFIYIGRIHLGDREIKDELMLIVLPNGSWTLLRIGNLMEMTLDHETAHAAQPNQIV